LIILPLFVATIVAAAFVYGDLRIATGSIWPASIAHGVHNASWGALAGLTVTSSPVLVNEYLAGDTGVFILMATIVAAFLPAQVASATFANGVVKLMESVVRQWGRS
jgi:uncharacterized protein